MKKYATYPSNIIAPAKRGSFFFGKQNNKSTIAAIPEIIVSNLNSAWNGTGIIRAESPTTNKILKILLPIMFPIAISEFFFIAAVTDVNNSGSEVPKATIVNPINLWLSPNFSAMNVADFTTKLLPAMIRASPITVNKIAFIKGISFISVSSEAVFTLDVSSIEFCNNALRSFLLK